MPFRDFFRGVLGLPPRNSDENNNRDVWGNDLFYDLFRDFSAVLDESGQSYQSPDGQREDEDIFRMDRSQDDLNFDVFPDPHDMFRHFEEQFRRTFSSFGLMDFPPEYGLPLERPGEGAGPEMPGPDAGSLRDRMLKPPSLVPPPSAGTQPRQDSDIDHRVSDGDLSALWGSQPEVSQPPDGNGDVTRRDVITPFGNFGSPFGNFTGQSYSVRRFQGPDGRVEERRVVRGSDGGCEETVTRRLGDQEEVVITRRRPDGTTEHEQRTTNIEQDSAADFDRRWSDPGSAHPDPSDLMRPPAGPRSDQNFWSNLFGW